MIELISKGGQLIWPLLGCLAFAGAVFLERLSYYHRIRVNVGEFMTGLSSLIHRRNLAEALQEAAAMRVPAGRVIMAAVSCHDCPREELKQIVQEAGQLEVPRLERYLSALHATTHLALLLGLLGTLLGLLDSFSNLATVGGAFSTSEIAQGLYQSLVNAALGVAVAIPSYLAYSFLAAKCRTMIHELERVGIEVVQMLDDARDLGNIVEFKQFPETNGNEKNAYQARSLYTTGSL